MSRSQTLFLARLWLSRVFDVAAVTSEQLSATLRLTGHGWTSLVSLSMTQSTILNSSDTKPSSNIVTQLIMKIKARVSSQKQYSVKIPVRRSQSIYLNPSVNGLCQNCSYKLMTECRAHNTVIISQVTLLASQNNTRYRRDLESEAEATGTWRGHRWSGDTVTWGWCGGGRGPRPSSPSETGLLRTPSQSTTSSGQTRTRGGFGSIK